jgi:hypothetical protein
MTPALKQDIYSAISVQTKPISNGNVANGTPKSLDPQLSTLLVN